jgi:hypothetical protein
MAYHPLSAGRDCSFSANQGLVLRHRFYPEKIGLKTVMRKEQMKNLSEARDYRNRMQPAKRCKT